MVSGADVNFRKITASLNKSCVLNQTICTALKYCCGVCGQKHRRWDQGTMRSTNGDQSDYEAGAADLVTRGEKTKLMKQ